MIVQTAPQGAPRFVILMAQHTALSGRFARAFGNQAFEPVGNREMHFVIGNHDAGWAGLDARFLIDPGTGFPYNLVETPFALTMRTSRASPDINEAHHPFCGLLSSMHSWGLYNGRYGLSDLVLLDQLKEKDRDGAAAMLAREESRQDRLKAALRANPDTADWVDDDRLMQAYKQLQFFDTLALYFNRNHEGARAEAVFPHVPRDAAHDADIRITPLGEGRYRVDPYPFGADPLTVGFDGRYMEPVAGGVTQYPEAAAIPVATQTVSLMAG